MTACTPKAQQRQISLESGKKYVLKLLKRDFKAPPPKLAMREKPVDFTEAIAPQNKEEKANVLFPRGTLRTIFLFNGYYYLHQLAGQHHADGMSASLFGIWLVHPISFLACPILHVD